MEKWREKRWRVGDGSEHQKKGEEDLTGVDEGKSGGKSGSEWEDDSRGEGIIRGHLGEDDDTGQEDGETVTRGVRGGWLRGEDGGEGERAAEVHGRLKGEENGVDGVGDESVAGQAGSWSGAAGEMAGDGSSEPGGEAPGGNGRGRVAWVASVEEDEIFGKRKGYPTDRRPCDFRRELSDTPADVIDAWFAEANIPIGESVKNDPEKMRRVKQLMYTWKDAFITETAKMVGTELVVHSIPTWENAIPVRAKAKLYTPRERKWMEKNIPQLLEAKIIEHSFSPWSHQTKSVPKKDGDLRMVHVYCAINAATIPNAYPMKRIEPVLNYLLQSGLSVYFQADAANGYWAVPLVPEHAYKTAFDTHMGQFHYLRMGQGLAGAPQTYTRLKDIFAGPIIRKKTTPRLRPMVALTV